MQVPFQVSARGLALIAGFEGFSACPAPIAAGQAVIGHGHVIRRNEPHLQSACLSTGQALALLRDDCRTIELYLNAVLPDWVRAHHFDALSSFVFDEGIGAFDCSVLRERLAAGDRDGAGREFGKWVFAGGLRLRRLSIRRACERLMFAGVSDAGIDNERQRLSNLKGPL